MTPDTKALPMRDSDGVEVVPGCTISFSYGIPPVPVLAKVVDRGGIYIALTPGHNPSECQVDELPNHVGDFWVTDTPTSKE